MRITTADLMGHGKEITITVLLLALLFTSIMASHYEGKANTAEATQKRKENIQTTEAGRQEIQAREKTEYPALDKSAQDIRTKREALKKAQTSLPVTTRKEIDDAITRTTKGDSNRLADLFRADGYPCAVIQR